MNEGLRVLMASAFYKDNEPGGIAAGFQFNGDDGVEFTWTSTTSMACRTCWSTWRAERRVGTS